MDVFFVLSGCLITSILLDELRRTDRISLGNVYMRRFLRLTPPLVVLALFQFVRSAFSQNGSEIREATIVGVACLENWNAVFDFAPHDVMAHTWALAVEEQFIGCGRCCFRCFSKSDRAHGSPARSPQ